ncbi:hypothetical protein J3D56_004018 [Erwinia persicina]|jgi:hypothetical protein|uniref:Arc family DNA-binding protein n=2 Tax=Erwinia TaxID=551 RepID=A0ABV4E8D9_9GAMM|nr:MULTISPECIES: hypothetical protein [Erwinia]MCP1440582.1 hypothetical protein [Erwinia persicina]MDN4626078.1 hypothetical protein [Erwinia sp. PsM31]RRZ94458.1 hypothetical protein EGK14_05290 [Erwinia sp. 198]
MTDAVSLTLKIDPALKETLKNLAQENQISLSQEVSQRLQLSLTTQQHPAVDNQSVLEDVDPQLNASELKQVRALLKKTKKKK